MNLSLVIAELGHSFIAHSDRHLFHVVSLTEQEIIRSGLGSDCFEMSSGYR